MKTISAVFDNLKAGEKKTIAVGAAADYDVLGAVRNAYDEGIANAILVGQESAIKKVAAENNIDIAPFKIVNVEGDVEAARTAVKMVHDGEADLSMKGMVQSPDFLRAVLDKEIGLRREGST
ncbi:phosphate butyryltransferase, partial [Ruminococcaceae bacterium OttesenSCG-928-O06]|nr:phosphate butyryltransferase [Ruminococcaceae bacterium OttesenSCG-928-O06]